MFAAWVLAELKSPRRPIKQKFNNARSLYMLK